jgi:hypothetical protein
MGGDRMQPTLSQREINDAEWQNPDNWNGCGIPYRVYFSKKDSRLWVGMWRNSWLSPNTINLGHPWGPTVFGVIMAVSMCVAAAVGWLASRDYLLKH